MLAADNRRGVLLEGAALSIILLLAAYLRMGKPGITEFKRDEANLSRLALEVARGRDLPLLGIVSSVGFPNTPVSVYILSIPYLLSSDPRIAVQFIGLLNTFAAGLIYVIARRCCGPGAALLAVLVYAINPWAVIFSRKIWAQNMLPVFVLLTMLAGLAGFTDGKRWGQWVFMPLLVVTGQLHYGAFVMIPAALWIVWQGRRRITRIFWYSLVPAALLTVPYLVGLQRADLLSVGKIRAATSSGAQAVQLDISADALRGAVTMVTGMDIHALAGPREFQNYLASVPDVYPLWNLLSLAVTASAFWLLARSIRWRGSRTPVDVLLLLWLVFPVAAFTIRWTPFHVHYLIPILPAAFLILAFAADDLWAALRGNRIFRRSLYAAAGCALVGILVTQVWLWLALLDFVNTRATPDGFGTPVHYLLRVRDAILTQRPGQVLARLDGQAVGFDGEATVWDTLLVDVPVVRFEDAATRVFPSEPALLLTLGCSESAGTVFDLRPAEGCYTLDSRLPLADPAAAGDTSISAEQPRRFANGVNLLAYGWDQRCLALYWGISAPATTDYMFAVHFFDAHDTRLAVADGLSWLGRYWMAGDTVQRVFCLPSPNADIVSVQVGMYTYDGAQFFHVDVLDAESRPSGQMVTLQLGPGSES